MKRLDILFSLFLLLSCSGAIDPADNPVPAESPVPEAGGIDLSPAGLARLFSELPIRAEHLKEVHDAVGSSSGNGYDEEYTMSCLVDSPGSGVGEDPGTKAVKAASYHTPLRDLLREHLGRKAATRAGAEDILEALARTDYQLYWPYSDDWDGRSFPVITFDPGSGIETNYGYEISLGPDGAHIVDSVFVDEALAMKRPVWVFNSNSDAAFTPLRKALAVRDAQGAGGRASGSASAPLSRPRKLLLKSLKMLRNYDSWFGGASEFWVKCGAVEGFNATTDAELKLYNPSVTDFMIVVKRRQIGEEIPYEAILVSDFSTQLDKLAFLLLEDDGGTRTSWKAEVQVKIQSKSYGLSIDIPYNEKDDIVWRGQLSARFFEEEDVVEGRFGDVVVSFELD